MNVEYASASRHEGPTLAEPPATPNRRPPLHDGQHGRTVARMSTSAGPAATAPPARSGAPTPFRLAIGLLLNLAVTIVVLGVVWGDLGAFASDPLHIAAIVMGIVPTIAYAGWTSRGGAGVKAVDEGRYYVLAMNLLAGAAIVGIVWLDGRAMLRLPGGEALRWIGAFVMLAGTVLRAGSMVQLGRRFSLRVALQLDHVLETRGFYKHIRHPSYLGSLLMLIGFALVFRSVVGMVLAFALGVMSGRIAREERFMAEQFGAEWQAYAARTRRLIPGIW
jgi:protein-S-isoprenylcysteine O-methyltransferase Ste14